MEVVYLPKLVTFAFGRPQISKFRRQNPVEPETPNPRVVKDASYGVACRRPLKFGPDRAPRQRKGFEWK